MMHRAMMAGRSDKSKQDFYARVVENILADPGIEPGNVLITISAGRFVMALLSSWINDYKQGMRDLC